LISLELHGESAVRKRLAKVNDLEPDRHITITSCERELA